MSRKIAMLTCCGVMQELNRDFWSWETDELKMLDEAQSGNLEPMLNMVVKRLNVAGMDVEECHGIVHDKDTRKVWSEAASNYVVLVKKKHIHIVLRFVKGKGGTPDAIARAIGVETQFIEKPARGRYAYDNMLSYLVHAKDKDKYRYSVSSVVSLGVKTFTEYYSERRELWEIGEAIKSRKRAEETVDGLEAKILAGEVTRQQVFLTDEYFEVYARFKRRLDDAFETYAEQKAYRTIQALEAGDFKLSVIFITGRAGAGKTRFAKHVVSFMANWFNWSVMQTAATNPLDDYAGEDIIFMDDVRGGSMSASDWLKLLDPYNFSPVSARYHNKIPACRCIIITSVKEPLEFFYYCKSLGGDKSEAMDQFIRRIMSRVVVMKADNWVDTRFCIADVERKEPSELVYVPGKEGDIPIEMHYGFGSEETMDETVALKYLLSHVMDNNGVVEEIEKTEFVGDSDSNSELAN